MAAPFPTKSCSEYNIATELAKAGVTEFARYHEIVMKHCLNIMGDRADYLARDERMDVAGTAIEVARELGITLGIGGHSLEVPIQCERLGIKPSYTLKCAGRSAGASARCDTKWGTF